MNEKEILFKLGSKIRFERFKRNLSQEGFAQLVGLSTRTISTLETGTNNIKFISLCKIANALDLEIKDLVDFKL